MAIGIWTPVVGSGIQIVFEERLSTHTAKVRTTALAAGTHMRFTVMGCHPVYICAANPATDDNGFAGTPIAPGTDVVMPRVSPIWVFSPYDNTTVIADVGVLS